MSSELSQLKATTLFLHYTETNASAPVFSKQIGQTVKTSCTCIPLRYISPVCVQFLTTVQWKWVIAALIRNCILLSNKLHTQVYIYKDEFNR